MNPPQRDMMQGADETKEELERSWVQRALADYTAIQSGAESTASAKPTLESDEYEEGEEDRKPAAVDKKPAAVSAIPSEAGSGGDEEDVQSTSSQNSNSSAASSIDSQTVQALNEAISLLHEDERKEYERVRKEKPHLIERDSNPAWYLQHCNFDQWQAAKKLASYWKERFQWFGERALLPMTQTGDGCLSKQDVSMLKTGFYAVVSNDNSGRTVLVTDASRRKRKDHPCIMRVHFYFNHILMQNPMTARKGITVVIVLSKATLDLAGQHAQDRIKVAKRVFPHGVHSVHIICRNDFANPLRTFLDEAIPFLFQMFASLKRNKHFHRRTNTDSDQSSFLEKMETDFGLRKENLPDCIGGEWTSAHFAEWRERQIRIEWDLPLGDLTPGGEQEKDEDEALGDKAPLTAAERKERKRKYNVLHSRRKRLRLRQEKDLLRGQINKLEREQNAHKDEGIRLGRLLRMATETLKKHFRQQGINVSPDWTVEADFTSTSQPAFAALSHHQGTTSQAGRLQVGGQGSTSSFVPQTAIVARQNSNSILSPSNISSSDELSALLFHQQQQQRQQWLNAPFIGNANHLARSGAYLMPSAVNQQPLSSQPAWLSNVALEQQRQREFFLRQNLNSIAATSSLQGVASTSRQHMASNPTNVSSAEAVPFPQSEGREYGSDQRHDKPPSSFRRKQN